MTADMRPRRGRISAGLVRLVPLAAALALAACADASGNPGRGSGPSVRALNSMLAQEREVTRGYIKLGDRAEKGEAGPRDPARAAYWYQKAADRNDPTALAKLGSLYVRGDGVPRDPEWAADLFRRASAMGRV